MSTQTLFGYCQRHFDPKETMYQLHTTTADAGDIIKEHWKIDPRVSVLTDADEDDAPFGMIFKVNHSNYSDIVMITLDWDDTYHIRFMDRDEKVTHEIDSVYFDSLFETINNYFNFGILIKDICLN